MCQRRFVTPALYALLGIGLAALAYIWKPLPWLGAVLLVVGLVPAQQADLYDSRFDREHVAEVAAGSRQTQNPATPSLSTRNIHLASTGSLT